MNYKYKYFKYKKKYLYLKYGLHGGFSPTWKKRVNSSINISNIYENDSLMKKISIKKKYQPYPKYTDPKLYPSEGYNIKNACYTDTISKKNDQVRLLLFNVHNFVKQCDNKDEIKRDFNHVYNFISDKEIDYLLLTEMAPIKKEKDAINKGNFEPFINKIKNIELNHNFMARTHYIPDSIPYYFFLVNGIFSKNKLVDINTYNIGSNRILMECKIYIHNIPILLYLAHVEDKYDKNKINYDENIGNIIDIIKNKIKEYKIENVILCGDMNFPIYEYDTNEKNRKIFLEDETNRNIFKHAYQMYPVNKINPLKDLNNYLKYIEPINKNQTTFTGFNKRLIIDHFFVSLSLLNKFSISSKIIKSDVSDHYPVLLEIQ
uniref:Endonuclease/exonuclease/phosphatase family protein n=1 Tax=Mimivirus LCMiAC02 TaxID=2506609 RepID=A0A481Z1X3_9VIRU|nr:MAG: endonuclease/exonuclease/phosphatase family protein [Mimivirus LCMiAC02]